MKLEQIGPIIRQCYKKYRRHTYYPGAFDKKEGIRKMLGDFAEDISITKNHRKLVWACLFIFLGLLVVSVKLMSVTLYWTGGMTLIAAGLIMYLMFHLCQYATKAAYIKLEFSKYLRNQVFMDEEYWRLVGNTINGDELTVRAQEIIQDTNDAFAEEIENRDQNV